MVNNGDVVSSHVDVEFDSIRAEVERPLEGGNRVFGRLAISPSMGDDFWSPGHAKLGSESNYGN